MQSVTLEEAQLRLAELIDSLPPGEEVVITRGDRTVAKLQAVQNLGHPVAGRGKGKLTILSEDDDHLRDFDEYMP